MQYDPKDIERKWREKWQADKTYQVLNDPAKPKYYVLDMFPYPSGAGLHVGHPLGYIASDIVARYKRHNGFNVLHPMGYDSFGLPAEQYAIQTGQHPAKTTEVNIARYREQLDNIGFSFDWSREVRTSDPPTTSGRSGSSCSSSTAGTTTPRSRPSPLRSSPRASPRRAGHRPMPAPSPAMWRKSSAPSPQRMDRLR
jgi:hypothetical protein